MVYIDWNDELEIMKVEKRSIFKMKLTASKNLLQKASTNHCDFYSFFGYTYHFKLQQTVFRETLWLSAHAPQNTY